MDKKLEFLKEMKEEYGDVKISRLIKELELCQEKPKSLEDIRIKGERYNGRGCYECAGEHGAIWADNLLEFLISEFEYLYDKDIESKPYEDICDIPKTVATSFAEMIVEGEMGDDYYTSYKFKLSHKASIEDIATMITNELGIEEYELGKIESDGFNKWYKERHRW